MIYLIQFSGMQAKGHIRLDTFVPGHKCPGFIPLPHPRHEKTKRTFYTSINVDSRLIPDDQKIVIGKFVHENAEVLDLIFENELGERENLGVTSEHPIYSKDRNCWVPAGNLHTNENVKTSDNLKVWLVEKSQRLGKHKVYNLEVHRSHTFFVSKFKILVHNTCGQDLLDKLKECNQTSTSQQILSNFKASNIIIDNSIEALGFFDESGNITINAKECKNIANMIYTLIHEGRHYLDFKKGILVNLDSLPEKEYAGQLLFEEMRARGAEAGFLLKNPNLKSNVVISSANRAIKEIERTERIIFEKDKERGHQYADHEIYTVEQREKAIKAFQEFSTN